MSRHFIPRERMSEQARDALKRLWAHLSTLRGHNLTAAEFFPVNLDVLVRDILKWSLEQVATLPPADDFCKVHGRCNFKEKVISLAIDESRTQGEQNFTLAHEVGHVILHAAKYEYLVARDRVRPITGRPKRKPPIEEEADSFAADLLMPENAVRERFIATFDKEALWTGSSYVREILSGEKKSAKSTSRYSSLDSHEVEVSQTLAAFRGQSGQSMAEFFAVSRWAMGRKIRELGLVYPG